MNRMTLVMVTALIYAVTGWLSLQLAIAPDYVSMVFVPAGVALAAVMVYGSGSLAGIFLGALAVQWIATAQVGLAGWRWTLLVGAVGAVAQAQVGAWLARRWVQYPNPLDTPKAVMRLLLGVIPVSTLINASFSVPVLVSAHVLPVSTALSSWGGWWLGDALGAGLALPVALVLVGRPAEQWRSRRKGLIVPMGVAAALVVLGIFQTNAWDKGVRERRFDSFASDMAGKAQRRLDAQADSVLAVSRLFAVQDHIGAADFKVTVTPWLERYPGTRNFGWSPLITREQRNSYVAAMRKGGEADFDIRSRDKAGKTYVSEPLAEYLPVTLVEPLEANRSVMGLNILALGATAQAVLSTRSSGKPWATEGIRLVQETGEQRGVVIYQAVFGDGEGKPFIGVVSAVFRMDDVLVAALGNVQNPGVQTCLVDTQASNTNKRLAGPVGCEALSWLGHGLQARRALEFGNRQWEMRFIPDETFGLADGNLSTWMLVATGLFSVALLGAFLLVTTGESRRTRSLVQLRTAELAKSNADLLRLSQIDTLTGLPNRSHLIALASAALAAGRSRNEILAIIFLDLDRFKQINDTLGHAMGDKLLQAVAAKVGSCLRRHDVLARLGGDEFVVLLPGLSSRNAAVPVVEKMVRLLSQPLEFGGHETTVTVSAGLAITSGDEQDIDSLLRQADTAMYAAKDGGRNGWRVYAPDMEQRLSQRMFIENGLRRALERGELFVQYQPQVEAASGRVTGVEALVRWNSPERGLIGPDVFIPVAEDCGLIEPIGRWVLHSASAQLVAWQDQGIKGLQMAVNISAMQFQQPSFMATLRDVLTTTGIEPQSLELEITESLLMQPLADLHARLKELAAMGVTLALDDFGTGYSSLGYLKRLPLTRLKIDRTFVSGLPDNAEDVAITRATLSMARDLGMSVVAEGVETAAQRDYLVGHGCTLLQGWLYAKPMRGADFPAWYAQFNQEVLSAA